MSKVTVLSPKTAAANRLYLNLMAEAEAASGDAASALRRHWWALLTIKEQQLWKAGGYETETAWVASFSTEPWAPSRATFYGVMQAVDSWRALGADADDVHELLGKRKVAIESDLRTWFQGGKDHELRPEVAMMLAAKHETPLQALHRIAELAPAQARSAISEVVDREYFYVQADTVRQLNATTWEYIVVHEHSRKGLLGKYRSRMTISPIEEKGHKRPGFVAAAIEWLLSRFG